MKNVMKRLPALFLCLCTALLWADQIWADQKPKIPPRFKVDVEEVVLRVTVTDSLNRYVVGLEKEHFKIFEEKVEQTVTHFSNDKSPLSVGIILDISGSMGDNMLSARNSVVRFLEQGDTEDEYFLIGFNHQTRLLQDFTPKNENIKAEIAFTGASGRTALYDAVYLGLEKIKESRHDKRALIIITDGEDNSSRYTFSEVKDFAKESDAQIYVIGEKGDIGYGRGIINEIVRLTGGRAFFPSSFKQLDYYCDLIHTELRNQYVLGYISTDKNYDGKWRKIRVRLEPPEGLPRLSVRSKEGYFAPQK
jgi:Ca-activated chloride channel homolog